MAKTNIVKLCANCGWNHECDSVENIDQIRWANAIIPYNVGVRLQEINLLTYY